MKYTRLGNTGLEVSKLCLGCMSFGDASQGFHSGWLLDEEKSRVIIKKALDMGINFLTLQMFMVKGLVKNIWGVPYAILQIEKRLLLQQKCFSETVSMREEIQLVYLERLFLAKLKQA